MKKLVATMHAPGRLTVLAALLAGLSAPAMAASPNLVISQVYGAGGNAGSVFKHDYIEIFNRGATSVTATGWSLQYASATGTGTWNKAALPDFTVAAGQYVLIQGATGGGAQTGLPAPIIVPSFLLQMSGSTGKLALVSDNVQLTGAVPATTTIVDLLGFGPTANNSETAPSPVASATLALFRAQSGCTDTDNNAQDFTSAAPAPRTSDSPLNNCSGTPSAAPIVLTCPSSLAIEQGVGGMVALSGTDSDSIVNGASITSAAVPGISLAGFTAASANGGVASVSLQAGASVAAGSHPVTVLFTNNAGQEKSCTITVAVTGVASISQIQGSGDTSPFNNQVVITEGVVTHKVPNGYFLQDSGDGNPDTSDGLFVFTPGAVNVGERVRVRGTITEFRPTTTAPLTYTEMKDVTATTVLSKENSVAPTNISFDGTQDLERFEGMLVNITNSLTINQSSFLGTRGELTLAAGRRETATNRYRPLTPEAIALAAANARNSLVLDDSLFVAPTIIPYVDGGARVVRAGDTVTGLTGVIDYGSIGGGAGFKLQYTTEPSFSATNPRTGAPQLGAGIKVASANVLNYFTTFTNGANTDNETGMGCQLGATNVKENCRGADNAEEFVRQTNKIVSALVALDADVIGLMEVQNNGDIATAYLAQQLNNAVGFQAYAHVPAPAATGTDAIRVSMLYKPAKVQLVGAAMSDPDPVNTRPPMAQTFKAGNGGKFSLVVNHMHAKASSCTGVNADQGDGQGCSNVRRTQQATRLANVFIPQIISAAGDPDVLVMGDLNANGQEDPIYTLTQSGLVNQLERFVRPAATPYSYVFNGEVGYLDHALATATLDAQMTGAAQWHNNADEPTIIDYNLDGKNINALALYQDHAYRSSDHDPVVVSMNLPATVTDVSAGFTVQRSAVIQNRVTGKISATITLTNVSGKPMTGPFYVQFTNLTPGVIVENATGMKDGMYYIAVNNASIAPGAKATLSAVYLNPNKVVFGHTNKVFNGTY